MDRVITICDCMFPKNSCSPAENFRVRAIHFDSAIARIFAYVSNIPIKWCVHWLCNKKNFRLDESKNYVKDLCE